MQIDDIEEKLRFISKRTMTTELIFACNLYNTVIDVTSYLLVKRVYTESTNLVNQILFYLSFIHTY